MLYPCFRVVGRHGDVPWLPRLSALGGVGKLVFPGTGGGGGKGGQCERFETLGVNEGDSCDLKKVGREEGGINALLKVLLRFGHIVQ